MKSVLDCILEYLPFIGWRRLSELEAADGFLDPAYEWSAFVVQAFGVGVVLWAEPVGPRSP